VLGFYVKDYTAASKQFRLDAGSSGSPKIAGRTRYLTLTHENVALIQWDGTHWQPLVLNLDSPWVDGGAITITAVTTNPTKGTMARDKVYWRRNGQLIHARYIYSQSATGSSATGSGDYLYTLPIGTWGPDVEVDTTALTAFTAPRYILGGYSGTFGTNGTTVGYMAPIPYNTTKFRIRYITSTGATQVFQSSANTPLTNATIDMVIDW
jgi:hypothetical protein